MVRSIQARFNAAQLITQRELVSGMIQDRLRERAADFFIDLDDVSIVRPAVLLVDGISPPSQSFESHSVFCFLASDPSELRARVYRGHRS